MKAVAEGKEERKEVYVGVWVRVERKKEKNHLYITYGPNHTQNFSFSSPRPAVVSPALGWPEWLPVADSSSTECSMARLIHALWSLCITTVLVTSATQGKGDLREAALGKQGCFCFEADLVILRIINLRGTSWEVRKRNKAPFGYQTEEAVGNSAISEIKPCFFENKQWKELAEQYLSTAFVGHVKIFSN